MSRSPYTSVVECRSNVCNSRNRHESCFVFVFLTVFSICMWGVPRCFFFFFFVSLAANVKTAAVALIAVGRSFVLEPFTVLLVSVLVSALLYAYFCRGSKDDVQVNDGAAVRLEWCGQRFRPRSVVLDFFVLGCRVAAKSQLRVHILPALARRRYACFLARVRTALNETLVVCIY